MHDEPHDYQRYTTHGIRYQVEKNGLELVEIRPKLKAVETGGLMLCLSLGGVMIKSAKEKRLSILLFPILIAAITLINMISWTLGRLLPEWPAMSSGFTALVKKPG